jgi:hypothetical protein
VSLSQVRPADDAATHPGHPLESEVQLVRGRRTTASPSVPRVRASTVSAESHQFQESRGLSAGLVSQSGLSCSPPLKPLWPSGQQQLGAVLPQSLAVQPATIRGRPAPNLGRRGNISEGPSCPACRSVCVYGQTSCRSTSFDGLADSGCWHDLT